MFFSDRSSDLYELLEPAAGEDAVQPGPESPLDGGSDLYELLEPPAGEDAVQPGSESPLRQQGEDHRLRDRLVTAVLSLQTGPDGSDANPLRTIHMARYSASIAALRPS